MRILLIFIIWSPKFETGFFVPKIFDLAQRQVMDLRQKLLSEVLWLVL